MLLFSVLQPLEAWFAFLLLLLDVLTLTGVKFDLSLINPHADHSQRELHSQ